MEGRFSRLLHYVERQGDAGVPASFTVDGYPPGSWVDMQPNRHGKSAWREAVDHHNVHYQAVDPARHTTHLLLRQAKANCVR